MTPSRPFGIDLTGVWRHGGIAAAAAVAAVILALLTAGFLAVAGYIALTRRFDAEIAALIVAGGLFLLLLLVVLTIRRAMTEARREMRAALSSNAMLALVPTAASLAGKHTRLAAVIAAAGVGFWLARDAGKRRPEDR